MIGYQYDDGGRAAAGYQGDARDCVVRAIAIATGDPYKDVYMSLWDTTKAPKTLRRSPRDGVQRKIYERYLLARGWHWTPTMRIGSGCRVHLNVDELPLGRIIVRLSRHLCAVIDGVIYDTHDPSERVTLVPAPELGEGRLKALERCVYGYFCRS